MYLPKSTFFGHEQAIVRGFLTGIDHNYNRDRQPALDVDGEEMYEVPKRFKGWQGVDSKNCQGAKEYFLAPGNR